MSDVLSVARLLLLKAEADGAELAAELNIASAMRKRARARMANEERLYKKYVAARKSLCKSLGLDETAAESDITEMMNTKRQRLANGEAAYEAGKAACEDGDAAVASFKRHIHFLENALETSN